MMRAVARLRVPLGFLCTAIALWLAQPTWMSLAIGGGVMAIGEAIRVWAAGHLEKGREITRSGPYRFVRHPLYLGSTLLGVGFAIASWRISIALLTAAYLIVTLVAAVRTEEATLDTRFAGEYTAYREGRAAPVERGFSWARAMGNREWRAMAGLLAVFLWLAWRAR